MRRVFVDPGAPQTDALQEAAAWIRDGGVVALAAHGRYVLVADARNKAAVDRVKAVVKRPPEDPIVPSDQPPDATARAVWAGAGRAVIAVPALGVDGRTVVDPDEIERSLGDSVDILLDTGRS